MNSYHIDEKESIISRTKESTLNEVLIRIELTKTNSKRFKAIVARFSQLPNYNYCENSKTHSFEIRGVRDYAMYYFEVEELIVVLSKWKSTTILLSGKEYSTPKDYADFKANEIGSYDIIFNSHSKCAIHSVTMEDLPLPVVYYPSHYGTFFGFSTDVNQKVYFCDCQKEAIKNYLRLREEKSFEGIADLRAAPLGTDDFSKHISEISLKDKKNPLSSFGFKKKLCFKCNKKVPRLKYCHPMYGTLFMQKYGWYINQKFYELGIERHRIENNDITIDKCPPNLYDEINHYNKLSFEVIETEYNTEKYKELEMYRRGITNAVEDMVRVELGFPKVGERWTSEVVLFNIVEGLYPGYKTKRHYRPKWLEGLEIDIYIPELKLAFEYQGIQHYKAVDHWGGEDQLHKQKQNDKRKKELCENHGVELIIVDYNEEISTENIKKRIFNSMRE